MTEQPRRRDDLVAAALDDLAVPAPRQTFFEDLERRLQAEHAAARRPRRWLRLAAAAPAAVALTLVASVWWATRPSGRSSGPPVAYALTLIRPLAAGPRHQLAWFIQDGAAYWITREPGAAKSVVRRVDMSSGAQTTDGPLTDLYAMPDIQVLGELPGRRMLVERSAKDGRAAPGRIDVQLAVVSGADLERARPLGLPYTLEPGLQGSFPTWRQGYHATSTHVAWVDLDHRLIPRDLAALAPPAGIKVCEIATGKVVAVPGTDPGSCDGKEPLVLGVAGTSVFWQREGEAVTRAYDAVTHRSVILPKAMTDPRRSPQVPVVLDAPATVLVSTDGFHLHFYDQRTGAVSSVRPSGRRYRILRLAALPGGVAWVEARYGESTETITPRTPASELALRFYDLSSHRTTTTARVPLAQDPPVMRGSILEAEKDRLYWGYDYYWAPEGDETAVVLYGATAWTSGDRLHLRLMRPAPSTSPSMSMSQ